MDRGPRIQNSAATRANRKKETGVRGQGQKVVNPQGQETERGRDLEVAIIREGHEVRDVPGIERGQNQTNGVQGHTVAQGPDRILTIGAENTEGQRGQGRERGKGHHREAGNVIGVVRSEKNQKKGPWSVSRVTHHP